MKDEALRLALEALEEISHVNTYQNEDDEVGMKFCCDQVSYQPHSTDCQTMKAIHAIKAALEQPEPEPEPVPNYCRECLTYNGHQEGCSHHTSPPKREPLTDEMNRQSTLAYPNDKPRLMAFIDGWFSAEQAHGIKENT